MLSHIWLWLHCLTTLTFDGRGNIRYITLSCFNESKHLPVYKSIKQRAMTHLYEGIFMPTSSIQVIHPNFLVCFFGLKHCRKNNSFSLPNAASTFTTYTLTLLGAEQVVSSQIIGDFIWKQPLDAMRRTVGKSGFCGPKTKTMSYKCLIKGKKYIHPVLSHNSQKQHTFCISYNDALVIQNA